MECQDSITALSSADPTHRLGDAELPARLAEGAGGVLTALVGVHDHLGDGVGAAADRNRHHQGGLGQVGVVMRGPLRMRSDRELSNEVMNRILRELDLEESRLEI